MVGKYGETLVVDWGLSKLINRPDTEFYNDEVSLRPSSASGTQPTQMGSAIGTPHYMPPEQAAGRLDDLGPQSDVYSLGATLYYLLTGVPPFKKGEAGLGQLLNDVQAGKFLTPIQVNASIPKGLNAICIKAMAKSTKDRFSSALDLKLEIERWLADEPIECFEESIATRLGRRIRKNQTAFVAGTVVTVLVAIGMVIFSSLVASNNRILSQKNSEIRNQADEISRVNGELELTNNNLETSLTNESRLRAESEDRLILAETRLAETYFEKANNLCNASRPDHGLHWLVRSLEVVPDSSELPAAIRLALGFWQPRTLCLNHILEHEKQITTVSYSADSTVILTASFDRTARLWSAQTGLPLGPPLAGTHQIEAATLLSDRRTVILGCYDGTIRIYDGIKGEQLAETRLDGLIRSIKVNRDENIAVARTNSGTINLFHPKSGTAWEKFDLKIEGATSIDLHPQKNQLAVTKYHEKVFQTFDLESGQMMKQKETDTSPTLIQYSPDGNYLVAVSDRPQIFDSQTLESVSELLPQSGVRNIDFLGDGSRFVTAGLDGQAIIFSCPEGKLLAPAIKHPSQVFDAKISPDGKLILTSSRGLAQLWDAGTSERIGQPLPDSGKVEFAASNRQLICGSLNGAVRVWSLRPSGDNDKQLDLDGFPLDAEYNPDLERLIVVGEGSSIRIWDFDFSSGNEASVLNPTVELNTDSRISTVAMRKDGGFAVGGWNKSITFYDNDGRLRSHEPIEHDAIVQTLAFSPDEEMLISGGDDSVLAFWDAESGKPLGEPLQLEAPARQLRVGSNSKYRFAVAGGTSTTALVVDLGTRSIVHELMHDGEKRVIVFDISPDGQWIVSGDNKGKLRLWNSISGEMKWEYDGFQRGHQVCSFSPDGKKLLVGGYDRVARVIDTETGEPEKIAIRHKSPIMAGAFALDGEVIITGDEDGTTQLTHTSTGLPIGPLEKHRGKISMAMAIGHDRFLFGHGSLRLRRLQLADDQIEGLREIVTLLTGFGIAEDGSEAILDFEQFSRLKNEVLSMSAGQESTFWIPAEAEADVVGERHPSLSILANPISREKGRFSQTITSYTLPE